MNAPRCATCGRPFPANGELVSLPHGKRLAFDPELGRVWRICTKCGEWSAVDDAVVVSAAAADLGIRLLNATPSDQAAGAALFKTGPLEVLRVVVGQSTPTPIAIRSSVIARERRAFGIASIGILVVAVALFALDNDPRPVSVQRERDWIAGVPTTVPIFATIYLLAAALRSKRMKGSYGQWRFMAAIVLFGSVFALRPWEPRKSMLMLGAMLLCVALFSWIMTCIPYGRSRLASGRRRWVTRRTVDETRLLWDGDRAISLCLPSGERVAGHDALTLLRDLLHSSSWEHNHVMVAMAQEIATGPDPLAPVLYKLRPALEASPEGIMLGNINVIDRIALDLALATRVGATMEFVRMMQQAPPTYRAWAPS